MQFSVLTCLLVCLLFSGSAQFRDHQYKQMSVSEGSSTMLGCFVEGEEIQDPAVQWFKQLPGSVPTYIQYHENGSSVHWANPSLQRFHSISNSRNAQFLEIKNVSTEDSALYWCLQANQSIHPVWGDGIYLSVYGGKNVQAPSVFLMSSQESSEASNLPHVACLVTDFYPSVIEVTWKLDGQTAPGDFIAGPFQSEEDNTYSMINILDLSSHPRNNFSSVLCEVRHDSSRTHVTKDFSDCHRDT
ncbi:immunoglobulin kappa light chain-like [Mixophyes fleayi]|uniref:immunoglobulin kappa light chain-like n=1 Tax=Mixophyes fleayi TaxID=3061075 RepID=UPI003F4D9663